MTHSGAVAAVLLACAERPTEVTPLSRFASEVVPVLDARCGNCHGVSRETFAELQQDADDPWLLVWPVDPSGRVPAEHIQTAYDRCTGRAGEDLLQPLDLGAPAPASPLARAPLAAVLSNYPRSHPEVFTDEEDPGYRALLDWIEAERSAVDQRTPAPEPTEAGRFFGAEVTPILARKTCMGSSCHGTMAFNDLKLDPGLPSLPGRFTPAMLEANRQAMLGETTRLVHLSGDVTQSKQLLKNIPVSEGGVVHKGGNQFLSRGDPDFEVLVRWLELEAAELTERAGAPLGEQRGLIFVRRDRHTPERFFESDTYYPGAELIWQQDDGQTVLSAALSPAGEADIRAPDVSYDASRVAFAMRRSEEEPFDIWEIELATGEARQLTFSNDSRHHFVEPLYVPDEDDRDGLDLSRVDLIVMSNHLDEWARSSPEAILGEAEGGSSLTVEDRQLTERPGTFDGRRIAFVRGTNAGEIRRVARHTAGHLELDRPLPAPCDSTTHFAIEAEQRMAPRYDAFRLRLAAPGAERSTFERSLKRMTYTVDQVRRPTMRSDGSPVMTFLRVGWEQDRPYFNGALFRLHVDGSDFHPHNGNRSGVPIHSDDRELPNGLEVRIGRDADSWWGGTLLLADHQLGVTVEPDNPVDDLDHPEPAAQSAAHRFVPGWIQLDPAVTFKGISSGGAYRDPYPLPDGSLLVAHAPGPIDLSDPDEAPDFDILRLIPDPSLQSEDGFAAGPYQRVVEVSSDRAELWPRPVVVRAKESVDKRLVAAEHHSGPVGQVRGFEGYPDDVPMVVKVYDYRLVDAIFERPYPQGPKSIALPIDPISGQPVPEEDRVAALRVVAALPQREGDTGPPRRALVIEVPLEEDGSAHFVVPSGLSFTLQALNSRFMALRSMGRWMYGLPGEEFSMSVPYTLFPQACGGCHGSLTGRPSDTFGTVDAVTSASRTAATWDDPGHHKTEPVNYGEDLELTSVIFDEDIGPIIEARCTDCHGEDSSLDLQGEDAFEQLREHVAHSEALASRSWLIEVLTAEELDAPRDLPAHPTVLAEDELLALIRWIDLGATR